MTMTMAISTTLTIQAIVHNNTANGKQRSPAEARSRRARTVHHHRCHRVGMRCGATSGLGHTTSTRPTTIQRGTCPQRQRHKAFPQLSQPGIYVHFRHLHLPEQTWGMDAVPIHPNAIARVRAHRQHSCSRRNPRILFLCIYALKAQMESGWHWRLASSVALAVGTMARRHGAKGH